MQGIFVGNERPRSKKAVKEAVRESPGTVYVEKTSPLGNDYHGPVSEMPVGTQVTFVGPDPFTARNYYGMLKRTAKGFVVS